MNVTASELSEATDFYHMSEQAREAMIGPKASKRDKAEHARLSALCSLIQYKWRLELADEAWISKTITLPDGTVQIVWRRNPGTKKHPFDPNISVGYWPKPWGLMKKVKRSRTPQQSDMYEEISEPEQIGEILKRQ